MKRLLASFVIFTVIIFPTLAQAKSLSDNEIKKLIIQESIDSYSGNCPCPYNRASNGSKCGKRSAYSKPGGYAPLCYNSDVSDEDVKEYRKKYL